MTIDRDAEGAVEKLDRLITHRTSSRANYLPPFQHSQLATRVQFQLGALLQHSNTPSLRRAGFENEAPCEGGFLIGFTRG
ncbi:MAG TPA: hypothetical protein VE641_15185 [Chthoniobacterales bacterium]|nr:hypothetical protein [Chthoniobacterales bacterium]